MILRWFASLACALSLVGCTTSVGRPARDAKRGASAPALPDPERPQGRAEPGSIAIGPQHACAVLEGAVACWGRNDVGQLGTGGRAERFTPARISGIPDPVQVVVGAAHSCARTGAGVVYCWGDNRHGQLGAGEASGARPAPGPVRGLTDAVDLASGGDHVCAVRRGGSVLCWGDNRRGQAGVSGRASLLGPARVEGIDEVEAVVAGRTHSCALRKGAVLCWGRNDDGQLGGGARDGGGPRPRKAGVDGVTRLVAGGERTCASAGRTLTCWGRGRSERFELADLRALAVADEHLCVVDGAALRCRGSNEDGRLGDGTTEPRADFVAVAGLTGVSAVGLGDATSCAIATGGLHCWGGNERGLLGIGAPGSVRRLAPFPVTGLERGRGVAAGAGFTVAVRADGSVWAWGRNDAGQLGDGSTTPRRGPVRVEGLDDAVAVAAGRAHACAVRRSGAVSCWGANDAGQLGDGTRQARRRPVAAKGLTDAVAIVAGQEHTCARSRAGAVVCWGGDAEGQLGGGPKDNTGASERVVGLDEVSALTAGGRHTCAINRGSAVCWGSSSFGQLGDAAGGADLAKPKHSPVPVRGLAPATALAAGAAFTCALLTTGAVVCWGDNRKRQLGSGTSTDMWTTRVPVKQLADVAVLATGDEFACAVTRRAQLRCWGANDRGQLATGDARAVAVPASTGVALDDVSELALGEDHGCALQRDGTVQCWGDNEHGQLGDGGVPLLATPIRLAIGPP